MTANIWSVIVPLLLFCLFAFFNAPMLDKHLAEKYGDAFEEYRAKTKKIIPFIY
jgi:protein-S-isoprenylcysteine O-methyltransferase Ste14